MAKSKAKPSSKVKAKKKLNLSGGVFPQATAPPKLSQLEWYKTMLLGVVLIVMALLQVISFDDFRNALALTGLSSPSTWASMIILMELWAAVGFFKLELSRAFRMASSLFAILVSGFWFIEALRLASNGTGYLFNSAYFGRFLRQAPGWWTVIEASLFLFWTIWAVSLTKTD